MTLEPNTAAARPSAVPWPPLLLVAGLAGAWLAGQSWPTPVPSLGENAGWIVRTIGIAIGIAGVGLIAWTLWAFKRHDTTFLPNQPASHLVTSGPFALSRNPIYLAEVAIFLALALISKNLWFAAAAALFAILVNQLAIKPEERHLDALFGASFRAYRDKTRRWI